MDNATIALVTSWLYLPWVVKMLWGPLVDTRATKRQWILATQLVLAVGLLGVAGGAGPAGVPAGQPGGVRADGAWSRPRTTSPPTASTCTPWSPAQQAWFVGVRTMFYRAAMIFGSGLLVTLAGRLESRMSSVATAWTTTFAAGRRSSTPCSGCGTAWRCRVRSRTGRWRAPPPQRPRPSQPPNPPPGSCRSRRCGAGCAIFGAWFSQPRIAVVIAFILLYRLGEALLLKLAAPFLLDGREVGGLGFTTQQVGLSYGTVGLGCLVLGGVSGGWLIARFGLRRLLWPLALALNVPHVAYLYMAHAQPGPALAYPLVAIEQLGYGLGTTAFMVVLMRLSKGEHRTSHYAIATGFMALGMMLPGHGQRRRSRRRSATGTSSCWCWCWACRGC